MNDVQQSRQRALDLAALPVLREQARAAKEEYERAARALQAARDAAKRYAAVARRTGDSNAISEAACAADDASEAEKRAEAARRALNAANQEMYALEWRIRAQRGIGV